MKAVYSGAEHVFGSLCIRDGFTSDGITRAFKGTHIIYEGLSNDTSDHCAFMLNWIANHDEFRNMLHFSDSGSTLRAVLNFENHDFFSRVWIMQEICLARKFTFFLTRKSIQNWKFWGRFIKCFRRSLSCFDQTKACKILFRYHRDQSRHYSGFENRESSKTPLPTILQSATGAEQ